MIESGFHYLATLALIAGCLAILEQRYKETFFKHVPSIVLLYILVMVLASAGFWEQNEHIERTYSAVRQNILPSMIFLMLIQVDLRQVANLGPKMLLAFGLSVASLAAGFIVAFLLVKGVLPGDAWKNFAALSGSWMGGTANMVAVQGALDVSDTGMGYALIVDSIDYALWVVFLLMLTPFAPAFNAWTNARDKSILKVGKKLESMMQEQALPSNSTTLLFLLGVSLTVSVLCQSTGNLMPGTGFFGASAWVVMIATIMGIIASMTPARRVAGATDLANVMLFLIVALIASRADFQDLSEAPIYVLAGLIILIVHALLMVIFAKIFRLDLFTCGVASLANVGGVASAPILAATYSRFLIPVGVLMAMLGYVVGTAGGLTMGRILSALAGG
ncbi:MAG: DUF819 domain-containing protein [Hyphomonadaceae bacterium]|nr:DUF819 domain-containing protein [Hyphomonadaceae bacterium]MBC6412494.1 DUF819 domain-containing protein [Hyphomonadaceae bacterium]